MLRDWEKLLSIPLALQVWLQAGAGLSALSLEGTQDISIAEALPSLPRSTQVLLLQQVVALCQAGFRAVAKDPPCKAATQIGVPLAGMGRRLRWETLTSSSLGDRESQG